MAKKSTYPRILSVQVPESWPEALDKLAAKQAHTKSEMVRESIRKDLSANGLLQPEPLEAA
jgi:predicted DNA-binding protein